MSPLRPPKPPSVRDKSRRCAACSRRQGSSAAASLRRVCRRRHPRGSESHVGQQPLGAGTGPARMPRPLCEARGTRLGPGPPPPVWPSRGGASRGPGFGPSRPAAPCASPSARSSRFSLGLAPTGCAASPPPRASIFFLAPAPALNPRPPRVASGASCALSPRAPPGLACFAASRFPPPPHHRAGSLPAGRRRSSFLRPGFNVCFLFHFFLGQLAARRRFLRPQRPKGQGNKGEAGSAGGPGPGGGPASWGRGLRGAPLGEDLAEAA